MNRRNVISLSITLLVLIIVGLVIFPQFASYEEVTETITKLNAADTAFIFLFTAINIFIYAWPFMAATPGMRFWPAFIIRQTSFLLSNAFPGGGAVGVGVQYAMATSYTIKGAVASSGIISTSIWNMLTTISLPGISLVIVWMTGPHVDVASNPLVGILGIVAAVVSILGFTLVMKSNKLAVSIGTWIEQAYIIIRGRIQFLPKISIVTSLLDFRESTYKTTVLRWPLLLLSNLVQQVAQYSVLLIILIFLEPDGVSIALTFSAFAFARIGTFIPLTPGGLGTVDALLITLLIESGISSEVAAASTLLWRATTYFPQLFIGVMTFLYWRYKEMRIKL